MIQIQNKVTNYPINDNFSNIEELDAEYQESSLEVSETVQNSCYKNIQSKQIKMKNQKTTERSEMTEADSKDT